MAPFPWLLIWKFENRKLEYHLVWVCWVGAGIFSAWRSCDLQLLPRQIGREELVEQMYLSLGFRELEQKLHMIPIFKMKKWFWEFSLGKGINKTKQNKNQKTHLDEFFFSVGRGH